MEVEDEGVKVTIDVGLDRYFPTGVLSSLLLILLLVLSTRNSSINSCTAKLLPPSLLPPLVVSR